MRYNYDQTSYFIITITRLFAQQNYLATIISRKLHDPFPLAYETIPYLFHHYDSTNNNYSQYHYLNI